MTYLRTLSIVYICAIIMQLYKFYPIIMRFRDYYATIGQFQNKFIIMIRLSCNSFASIMELFCNYYTITPSVFHWYCYFRGQKWWNEVSKEVKLVTVVEGYPRAPFFL